MVAGDSNECIPRDFVVRYAWNRLVRSIYIPPYLFDLPDLYVEALVYQLTSASEVPIESFICTSVPLKKKDVVKHVMEALCAQATHLEQLHLQCCSLNDETIPVVRVLIEKCTHLTHLYLGGNHFSKAGETTLKNVIIQLAVEHGFLELCTLGDGGPLDFPEIQQNRIRNRITRRAHTTQSKRFSKGLSTELYPCPSLELNNVVCDKTDLSSPSTWASSMKTLHTLQLHETFYHNHIRVDYEISRMNLQLSFDIHVTKPSIHYMNSSPRVSAPIEALLHLARVVTRIEQSNRTILEEEDAYLRTVMQQFFNQVRDLIAQNTTLEVHNKAQQALISAERYIRKDMSRLEMSGWNTLLEHSTREWNTVINHQVERLIYTERFERKECETEELTLFSTYRIALRYIHEEHSKRHNITQWEEISRSDLQQKLLVD